MKKIIYFICIMLFAVCVKASPVVNYQEGIYSNRIGDKLYSGKMAFIFMNDHIVYCLDPFELVGRTYYEDNNYLNNMNKDNLKYFELVAYYGYNKTNRNSIYYYMAAQELIWERIIGQGKVFWSTGENDTGSRIDISNYKNEIINNINNFNTSPSFENEVIKSDYFDKKIFIDKNRVINFYNHSSEGKSILKRESNGISVIMLDHEKTKINLKRQIKTDNKTIIYTGVGNQTLGSFGINLTKTSQFYVEPNPYKTNVTITFYDKETNEILNDVEFKLCPDNELVNANGKYSGVFIEGKYQICELNNPYELTDDLLFEIKKEQLTAYTNIDFYLTKKEIPIKIPEKEEIKNEEEKNNEVKDLGLGSTEVLDKIILEKPIIIEDIPKELPNTYNYQFIKYSTLYIILLGSVLYKIKH